ncbi:hypothetical protein J6590_012932 [Homalodisca vitripennis]|nr:hypothetical protein J6590_012932 [Homalodisca vitripennis]
MVWWLHGGPHALVPSVQSPVHRSIMFNKSSHQCTDPSWCGDYITNHTTHHGFNNPVTSAQIHHGVVTTRWPSHFSSISPVTSAQIHHGVVTTRWPSRFSSISPVTSAQIHHGVVTTWWPSLLSSISPVTSAQIHHGVVTTWWPSLFSSISPVTSAQIHHGVVLPSLFSSIVSPIQSYLVYMCPHSLVHQSVSDNHSDFIVALTH